MKPLMKALVAVSIFTAASASLPALADDAHHMKGRMSAENMPMQGQTQNMMGNQSGMPMGGGYGGMGMMGGGMMMGAATFDEDWADKAKEKLGITGKQEDAWAAYVKAVRESFDNMQALRESMDPKAMHEMSQEDRVEFMKNMQQSRSEDAATVTKAAENLYGVLTDEQKKAASYVLPGSMTGGGYGMGMMGGGMMNRMMSHMMGQGYGGGMMGGGYGGMGMMGMGGSYGPCASEQGALDLTAENVKDILEGKIAMHGNQNLKVGKVAKKDDDTYTAEIVTKDGSLFQRLEIGRKTGYMNHVK